MKIIITGGAGYIGSHTAVEALRAGHEVIIIDSLINSSYEVIGRIEKAAGKSVTFYKLSLLDSAFDIYDEIGEHSKNADALIIATEWSEFRTPDFDKIESKLKNKVIFDGRNLYSKEVIKNSNLIYYSIGR